MKVPIAYPASPLGFSESGRLFHNTILIPMIREAGFEIRDPWTLTSAELINSARELPYGQKRRKAWRVVNHIIGLNNARAIKESDIIIAVLDGTDVDSGTAAEIGYGAALGKTVIGYRSDFRIIAENEGAAANLQIEYFTRLNGGEIVTSVESLKAALNKYRNHFPQ